MLPFWINIDTESPSAQLIDISYQHFLWNSDFDSRLIFMKNH